MLNPWLNVPLGDYEGHMGSPSVAQLAALSDLFAAALELCQPDSLAILGIAGGNGLERIDAGLTKRIVGVDIHPDYLRTVGERFAHLPLRLHCVDLETSRVPEAPVSLVHAALIFEHAGMGACLRSALQLVSEGGRLSVVLQLPSAGQARISPTPFASIKALGDCFELIDPTALRHAVESQGLALCHEATWALPAGKALWHAVFQRSQPSALADRRLAPR
ncbi:MAG: class I SAM-dependent methyltransferase [Bryobacterales bacterium]